MRRMRMIAAAAWAMVLMGAAPATGPALDALLVRMRSGDFAGREAAYQELVTRGPAVVEAVTAAARVEGDEEVKARLQQALLDIEEVRVLNARRVTLEVKDAALSEVVGRMGEQLGGSPEVSVTAAAAGRRVTLNVKDQPLLDVLARLQKENGLRPSREYSGLRLDVGKAGVEAVVGATKLAGIFDADVSWRDKPVFGGDGFGAGMEGNWRMVKVPQLAVRAWYANPDVRFRDEFIVTSAVDERDRPVTVTSMGSSGSATASAFLFEVQGGDAKMIRTLKGEFTYWSAIHRETVRLPLAEREWTEAGGMRFRVAEFTVGAFGRCAFRIDVEAPRMTAHAFAEFIETWRSLNDYLTWTDADGRRVYPSPQYQVPVDRAQQRVTMQGTVQGDAAVMAALAKGAAVLKVPTRVVKGSMAVELRDLEIPGKVGP